MTVVIVTGPPGSGKTLWTVQRGICLSVMQGKFVATNVRLSPGWADALARTNWQLRLRPRKRAKVVERWMRRVVYVETIGELAAVRLSTEGWEKQLEGRGVAVFDEAGEPLDAAESMRLAGEERERRKADKRFFREHRKLGWDVYLVAQEEEQIDARVRGLATYLVRLFNLRKMRLAWFMPLTLPIPLFRAKWEWHGTKGAAPYKIEVYRRNRSLSALYDTHQIVRPPAEEASAVWLPVGQASLLDVAAEEGSMVRVASESERIEFALRAAADEALEAAALQQPVDVAGGVDDDGRQ